LACDPENKELIQQIDITYTKEVCKTQMWFQFIARLKQQIHVQQKVFNLMKKESSLLILQEELSWTPKI
jgi:hypothetical protein